LRPLVLAVPEERPLRAPAMVVRLLAPLRPELLLLAEALRFVELRPELLDPALRE